MKLLVSLWLSPDSGCLVNNGDILLADVQLALHELSLVFSCLLYTSVIAFSFFLICRRTGLGCVVHISESSIAGVS